MRQFKDLPQHDPARRTMTYAGIGSRRTPDDILAAMTRVAERLALRGYTLNSGGAFGADTAFEVGAGTAKRVFYARDANDETRAIAREIHPAPQALHGYVLDLMARNTYQVFGAGLDRPVDFVLCWTPDGCQTHVYRSRLTGGTGQAISMADLKGIPVINMNWGDWLTRLTDLVLQKG